MLLCTKAKPLYMRDSVRYHILSDGQFDLSAKDTLPCYPHPAVRLISSISLDGKIKLILQSLFHDIVFSHLFWGGYQVISCLGATIKL